MFLYYGLIIVNKTFKFAFIFVQVQQIWSTDATYVSGCQKSFATNADLEPYQRNDT